MESPPRRARRPRGTEQVIDLRQAAASRNRGAEPTVVVEPGDVDLVDRALLDSVRRHGTPGLLRGLHALGRHLGSTSCRETAREVERTGPRLDAYDAAGARVDRVVTHPGWATLLRDGAEAGLAGRPWAVTDRHAHLARAAGLLLWGQTSGSSAMALSTSYAGTAALAGSPAQAAWLPRVAPARTGSGSRRSPGGPAGHDRQAGPVPVTDGAVGVALTEPGSSSVDPATTAVPLLGGPVHGGPTWRLSGRKWFAGNADADVLVVSASTPDGPGTFLVPRVLADGSGNGVRTDRLRPGPAYRAWVVGDLGLDRAWAVRLDPPGAGATGRVQARLQAARDLDAGALAAAAVRGALARAGHHARHRGVAGGPLDTTALVRSLLADLAVESEAASVLALRLAAATDAARGAPAGADAGPGSTQQAPQQDHGPERDQDARSTAVRHEAARTDPAQEAALLRLAAPVAAAWLSRRAPQVTLEAGELLGAAAWDDGSDVARLHRDASAVLAGRNGNGLALHVVDVVSDDPEAVEAFLAECGRARGAHPRLDSALVACTDLLHAAAAEGRKDPLAVQGAARWLVERCAVTLQAALVLRESPAPVAEAFLASRLDGAGLRVLGALPLGSQQTALVVDRALGEV